MRFATANSSQLLQSCEESLAPLLPQGFNANPGLELANAFSVRVLFGDDVTLFGVRLSKRMPEAAAR